MGVRFVFFFSSRRRHTRCGRDWSSDVCSSDLAAGDLLAAEHGLTSARWQVLGPIALAQRPLTVPQIARRMGLTRQSVHTTINRLVADGMVELTANADHRRSPLARLTELGRATYQAVDDKQAAWVSQLAAGL